MNTGSLGPMRPTDYLANERTFLAYVRTSLSVMAFGFVISKFVLFLRALPGVSALRLPSTGTSEGLGLAFSIFGCLLAALGVWRYVSTAKSLARNEFSEYPASNVIVGVATFLLGIAVVLSLVRLF